MRGSKADKTLLSLHVANQDLIPETISDTKTCP